MTNALIRGNISPTINELPPPEGFSASVIGNAVLLVSFYSVFHKSTYLTTGFKIYRAIWELKTGSIRPILAAGCSEWDEMVADMRVSLEEKVKQAHQARPDEYRAFVNRAFYWKLKAAEGGDAMGAPVSELAQYIRWR